MKKEIKIIEAIKLLDASQITEVKDKVVECIDSFMEENNIQTGSVEIF